MGNEAAAVAATVIRKMFGRRFLWRFGRSLYLAARRETSNDIGLNGERLIQQSAIRAAKAAGHAAVVIDVGANRGQWADAMISAAAAHKEPLTLISFEPVPEIHAVLGALFERRSGDGDFRLSARPLALSDQPGTARFSVMGGGDSVTHHLEAEDIETPERTIEVEVTTIDDLLAGEGVEFVDLLKIDCEGFDALVLKGAAQSLRSSRIGAVQFEYNHRWLQSRHYLRDIVRMAEDLPYAFGKVTPNGVELYNEWTPEMERFFEANYILIHSDRLRDYPVRPVLLDAANTYA